MTWREDVALAHAELGGRASLPELYRQVALIRVSAGSSLPPSYESIVRREMQQSRNRDSRAADNPTRGRWVSAEIMETPARARRYDVEGSTSAAGRLATSQGGLVILESGETLQVPAHIVRGGPFTVRDFIEESADSPPVSVVVSTGRPLPGDLLESSVNTPVQQGWTWDRTQTVITGARAGDGEAAARAASERYADLTGPVGAMIRVTTSTGRSFSFAAGDEPDWDEALEEGEEIEDVYAEVYTDYGDD